jgi:N-methylhydantoinase B/oxoprolinase/acetone carboxylase alpha subunit
VLVLESGGGGGWGDPARRNADAAARDVENGFVTAVPHPPAAQVPPSPRDAGRRSG